MKALILALTLSLTPLIGGCVEPYAVSVRGDGVGVEYYQPYGDPFYDPYYGETIYYDSFGFPLFLRGGHYYRYRDGYNHRRGYVGHPHDGGHNHGNNVHHGH